jgi:hypothetical protein
VLAVSLQVAVFNLFSVNGVVPNLALLVVVAAAIARGPQFGAVVGFVAGLLLDLAPPPTTWRALGAGARARRDPGGRVRDDAAAARSPARDRRRLLVRRHLGLRAQRRRPRRPRAARGEMMQVIAIALLWDVAVRRCCCRR